MKTCNRCKKELSAGEFHKKGSGLAPNCKPCTKLMRAADYKSRGLRDQIYARTVASRKSKRDLIAELKSAPCTDCGGTFHPAAMDFDHIEDNKTMNVSKGVQRGWSWERVLTEVAKCELVCANCHRVRTYDRLHSAV